MTGNCEKCKKETTEGIVVEGQVAGICKVLARVASIDAREAMVSVTDHVIEALGDRAEAAVMGGAPIELRLWVCGDCATAAGYRVGSMGTAVFREGVGGMGEVF